MSETPKENKEKFEKLYGKIKRAGSAELLAWLQKTDFFTAPASTKFHSSYEGGLCKHSLNVYDNLMDEVELYNKKASKEIPAESVLICALLHDLRKANYYKTSIRNIKNEETGVWEKQPFYQVEDQFPYGHGEGAVFLIERFMRLKTSEAVAIRWHMGGFDPAAKGGNGCASKAFAMYPLAVLLSVADLKATYIDESAQNDSQK